MRVAVEEFRPALENGFLPSQFDRKSRAGAKRLDCQADVQDSILSALTTSTIRSGYQIRPDFPSMRFSGAEAWGSLFLCPRRLGFTRPLRKQ